MGTNLTYQCMKTIIQLKFKSFRLYQIVVRVDFDDSEMLIFEM